MRTRVIPWTIEISNLATKLRVGIWDHEREYQPISVNISIRAITSASPQSIEDCLNYQPICHWITDEWPKQVHTPLLETKLCELIHFIFDFDTRIEWIDVAISKPKAIAEARGVGVRMAIARGDYESTFRSQKSSADENISDCHSVGSALLVSIWSAPSQQVVHCAPPSESSVNIGILPSTSLRHGRSL